MGSLTKNKACLRQRSTGHLECSCAHHWSRTTDWCGSTVTIVPVLANSGNISLTVLLLMPLQAWTRPHRCSTHTFALGDRNATSAFVHYVGSRGQEIRPAIVCSSTKRQLVSPSFLWPHSIRLILQRSIAVGKRFRQAQKGHISLEPRRSDSCGVTLTVKQAFS